jgi:hypothetical protein
MHDVWNAFGSVVHGTLYTTPGIEYVPLLQFLHSVFGGPRYCPSSHSSRHPRLLGLGSV